MLGDVHANLFVGGVSSVLKLYRALEYVFSDNHINVVSMPYTFRIGHRDNWQQS